PLLAVRVVDQRNPGAAVRIVLDLRHPARDAELVALEVDPPVHPLVAAPLVAHGDVALVVPAARLFLRLEQRLLGRRTGDLVEPRHRAEARAGRDRPELPDA